MERAPLAALVLAALALSVLSGCARHASARIPVPPQPARIGTEETGVASWYGNPYHGRPAASGEIYDMEKLTAAHRSFAFQTWLEVTNLSNGKRVEVRVTDRGPFVDGRIIDLSLAAARQIDMLRSGTARVRLKVIAPPHASTSETPARPSEIGPAKPMEIGDDPGLVDAAAGPAPAGLYAVQAGAFADMSRAEAVRDVLAARLPAPSGVRIVASPGDPQLWHVVAGRGLGMEEARALALEVQKVAGAAIVVGDPIVRDPSVRSRIAPISPARGRP